MWDENPGEKWCCLAWDIISTLSNHLLHERATLFGSQAISKLKLICGPVIVPYGPV